jgi:hypothetical protein
MDRWALREMAWDLMASLPTEARTTRVPSPACGDSQVVMEGISHLNDTHLWSREAIAAWLDTLDLDLTIRRSP